MINRLFFTVVCLFASVFTLQAQTSTDTLAKALLWRIDLPGAPAPSYLFGTIHLIDKADFLISDSLMSVLNRSDRVVFEIDPKDMTDPMLAMQLITKAFMKGDTTLRDLLTEEEYARVDKHFSEKLGLPMMMLDRIKPMFLSMLAGIDPSDMSGLLGQGGGGGESNLKSYELELDAIARSTEKEVGGLETTEFQMGLFDSIPYNAQAQMLLQSIQNPENSQANELERITKIYTTGDIDGMYNMTVGEEGGIGGFSQMLLVNRNKNWIEPIKVQAAKGSVLFAVGAGHLGGPDGVVRLLRAEGITLTPLSLR